MDDVSAAAVVAARNALHAVAELLLAGPQHRRTGEISLVVTDHGFATTAAGFDRLEVRGGEVVTGSGSAVPLRGSVATLAAALGIEPGAPEGLYATHATLGVHDQLDLQPDAAAVVLGALKAGDAALRALYAAEEPILWPEHFDVGITADGVNYGVSPGDAEHDLPYAYVGPWDARSGDFWNEPFGASRPIAALGTPAGILAFFRQGRQQT